MMASLFAGLPVLWESQDRLSKSIVVVTQSLVYASNTTGTTPSLQMMLNNLSSVVSRRMKLKVLKSNSILQNVSMTGLLKNRVSLVVNPPYVRLLMTFKKNWMFQLRLICLLSMIQAMPFR